MVEAHVKHDHWTQPTITYQQLSTHLEVTPSLDPQTLCTPSLLTSGMISLSLDICSPYHHGHTQLPNTKYPNTGHPGGRVAGLGCCSTTVDGSDSWNTGLCHEYHLPGLLCCVSYRNSWNITQTAPHTHLNLCNGCKDFWNPSKPCHLGIHWIALAEYSQMSTHGPGFQPFFRFFASFCNGQINNCTSRKTGNFNFLNLKSINCRLLPLLPR